MKVTVLSHDLSHNCLGRAEVLASLLAFGNEVEIVGPARNGRIWGPLADQSALKVRALPAGATVAEIATAADGDVLFAVKPRTASLGAALAARVERPRPVIADVDDWEMAFFYDNPRWMLRNVVVRGPEDFWSTARMERQVRRADGVTVSSTWLQRRFGGRVVHHARGDQEIRQDRESIRRSWGLSARDFAVVFLGSVRPHKIRTTLAAIDSLNDASVRLVLVDPERVVPERPYLVRIPPLPFDRVQEVLGGGDVVVLAQADTRIGRAQMPAKVFDAMAAGVPVIATDVSDLPTVLGDGGVVVPPGSPRSIASALGLIKDGPEAARVMGDRARARFRTRYHRDVLGPELCLMVEELAEKFLRGTHSAAPTLGDVR